MKILTSPQEVISIAIVELSGTLEIGLRTHGVIRKSFQNPNKNPEKDNLILC